MTAHATLGLMKLSELKDICREKNLPVSGRKDEVLQRIIDAIEAEESGEASVGFDMPGDVSDQVPYEIEAEARDRAVELTAASRAVVTISTETEYRLAGEFLTTRVKSALRELDDAFDPIIRSWHQGHKQTIAMKKKLAAPIRDVESEIKAAMVEFHNAFLEQQRKEQEALEAKMRADAEEAVYLAAAELYEQGKDDEADAMIAEMEGHQSDEGADLPVVKARKPQASAGVSTRTMRKFRIVDEDAIDRAFMHPDMRLIQMTVNEMGKAAEEAVGGIEYYEEQSIAARAR